MTDALKKIGGQVGGLWWQADVEVAANGSVRVMRLTHSDPELDVETAETGWAETYLTLHAARVSIEKYLQGNH